MHSTCLLRTAWKLLAGEPSLPVYLKSTYVSGKEEKSSNAWASLLKQCLRMRVEFPFLKLKFASKFCNRLKIFPSGWIQISLEKDYGLILYVVSSMCHDRWDWRPRTGSWTRILEVPCAGCVIGVLGGSSRRIRLGGRACFFCVVKRMKWIKTKLQWEQCLPGSQSTFNHLQKLLWAVDVHNWNTR